MVLEFQTLGSREIEAEEEPIPDPRLSTEEADEQYGKFVVEPLENGFGMTLGNPMRRALYSSLPGTAVTWVVLFLLPLRFLTFGGASESSSAGSPATSACASAPADLIALDRACTSVSVSASTLD